MVLDCMLDTLSGCGICILKLVSINIPPSSISRENSVSDAVDVHLIIEPKVALLILIFLKACIFLSLQKFGKWSLTEQPNYDDLASYN